jgi:hypothetical protein
MQVGAFLEGIRFTLPPADAWAAELDAQVCVAPRCSAMLQHGDAALLQHATLQRAIAPHDRWAAEMTQARGGAWANEMSQVGRYARSHARTHAHQVAREAGQVHCGCGPEARCSFCVRCDAL